MVHSQKGPRFHTSNLDVPCLVTPEDAKRMRARVVVLEHGSEIGEHTTECREELVIVLEGKIVLVGPDGERVLEKGQAAFIPIDTVHNVLNRTEKKARYIYVLALYDEYSKLKGHGHSHEPGHHQH